MDPSGKFVRFRLEEGPSERYLLRQAAFLHFPVRRGPDFKLRSRSSSSRLGAGEEPRAVSEIHCRLKAN